MWPRRQRQRTLQDWRQRRGAEQQFADFDAAGPAAGAGGARRRGRAPLPRLKLPTGSLRAHPSRLLSLALAAALALVALHLGFSSRYAVHGATVRGNSRTPSEIIVGASGLVGSNVFRIDQRAVVRRVEMLDDVRSARVGVGLPDRAWIIVEETAPLLAWETPGGTLVVDDTGRVIAAPADSPGLVRVRDNAGVLKGPGDRLPEGVAPTGKAFGARFGALTYDAATGFGLVTAEGWPVRLGLDASQAETQAATLAALAPKLAAAGRPVELVDLRFADGSYYRLKGETR